MTKFSNSDDMIDVRDITARIEELEDEQNDFEHDDDGNRTEADWADANPDDAAELATLASLMSDLAGYGGDVQWRGAWYPAVLIAESHFADYCQELVEDIHDMPDGMPSYLVINWKATADNLRIDYSEVEFDGETFLYR